jgi:hypothetical protein
MDEGKLSLYSSCHGQSSAPSSAKSSQVRRNKKQKKRFLLLEGLTASMLSVLAMMACISLFFLLWRSSTHQQNELEQEGLRWRRVSSLRWTLSRIKRPNKEDPFVVDDALSGSRLIFVFDHGVHVNPKLANWDLAQLYIDPQKGLVLVTRSHPKRSCIGQEEEEASVIWPRAKTIQWRFAIRPKDRNDKPGIEQYEQNKWVSTWRPDWPGLPAVIQAIVTDEKDVEHVITAIVLQDIGEIALK